MSSAPHVHSSARRRNLGPLPPVEADFVALHGDDEVLHVQWQGLSDASFLDRVFRDHINLVLRHPDRRVRSFAIWSTAPAPAATSALLVRNDVSVPITHVVLPELDAADLLATDHAFFAPAARLGAFDVDGLCTAVVDALVARGANEHEMAVALVAAASAGRHRAMKEAMERAGVARTPYLDRVESEILARH